MKNKLMALVIGVAFCLNSNMAMAQTSSGLELGLQAWTYKNLSFCETLEKAKSFGILYLEAYKGQKLGGGIEGNFGHQMDAATQAAVLEKLKNSGVTLAGYGVVNSSKESEWREIFTFAKAMKMQWVNCEAPEQMLPLLHQLAVEAGVKVALHNHPTPSRYSNPDVALKAAAPYPNVMGVCADTGHWVRSGYDPVESLKKCAGKIVTLHFKDKDQKDLKAIDVPWGTGVSDVKGQLTELLHQKFSGVVLIEYEHWTPQLDEEIGICVNYFRTFLSNVASKTVQPKNGS